MAVYIRIMKIDETETEARYAFMDADETRIGQFAINKETGEITLIEDMPGDSDGSMFSRAAHKVKQAFRLGNLPEVTCWAS